MRDQNKKIHIGTMEAPYGYINFTLVLNGSGDYHVERDIETRATLADKTTAIIPPADFDNYRIRGTKLTQLVAQKLKEVGTHLP